MAKIYKNSNHKLREIRENSPFPQMRVIPVTARAGAEPAERPKAGAKASSASGLGTIVLRLGIYRGGPSRTRAGEFPKVSLTGRRSLGDIGEISDRGRGFREENKEGGS